MRLISTAGIGVALAIGATTVHAEQTIELDTDDHDALDGAHGG